MSILRLFRKPTKQEIHLQIAEQIVLNALMIRVQIVEQSPVVSDRVGRELAFFGLYSVDRKAFTELGSTGRDELIDSVSQLTAIRYIDAIFSKSAPQDLIRSQRSSFIEQYNYTTDIYGHCKDIMSGPIGAEAGSVMFAFSYFIHTAITGDRDFDATDILCGRRKVEMSDLKHLPQFDKTLPWMLLLPHFINKKLVSLISSYK